MLDAYVDDIATRVEHVQPAPPELDVRGFPLPIGCTEVWRSADGLVRVEAVAVHHEPVREAVAHRVDLLVHEACRTSAMAALVTGTPFERIFDHHADTVALGRLAADVRRGGYDGPLTVGRDLMTTELTAGGSR
jgi:ribonuclease Z